MTIIPVILAGGSGTRLWPLSRELYPKQLLPLVGDRTMIQDTIHRLREVTDLGDPIVICNDDHRFLVAEQLRAIGIKPLAIILEPVGRNTAPAVTNAALRTLTSNPEGVLLVLPADHHISSPESFHDAVNAGAVLARDGHLITFGIAPRSPETGYGYMERGETICSRDGHVQAMKISRFVEKPDHSTAQRYLDSGSFFWNSGMFMFKAQSLIDEMKRFAPDIVEACAKSCDNGRVDLDFFRLDCDAFQWCPSDSIDYAVMEKTDRGVMIPLDAGWSDLGSWSALWEIKKRDSQENVAIGDVMLEDVKRSYVHSTSRLVAAIGVENHIIVETSDAVLVSTWDRVQDVKTLVQKLKSGKRPEALGHRKNYRPWGSYETLNLGDRFQVKRITVNPGGKLSRQKHYHRAEHWVVVHGTALIVRGDEQILLREDESTYIPLGFNHRLENPGKIPLELIEIQSGSYLGEDDIVRFEDDYGRQ